MQRRRFLPLAAAALAGCLGARDESGPRNPPTTPDGGAPASASGGLRVADLLPQAGEDGSLVAVVTVENTAESRRTDTLLAVATVNDGGTEHEARKEVSLPGGSEAEVTLTFEVPYEEWSGNGGLNLRWLSDL